MPPNPLAAIPDPWRAAAHAATLAALALAACSKPPADGHALKKWFASFNRWLTESDLGKAGRQARNIHGTFYDLLLATSATYCGNYPLAREVLSRVGPERLATQIAPDGSTPEELRRADAAMHTLWNLSGLLDLATLAQQHGIDLWHYPDPANPLLQRAAAFLLPFANGEKPWTFGQQPLHPPSANFIYWRLGPIYKDQRFENALRKNLGGPQPNPDTLSDPVRLLWPRDLPAPL